LLEVNCGSEIVDLGSKGKTESNFENSLWYLGGYFDIF
jgi:hypothetical protein